MHPSARYVRIGRDCRILTGCRLHTYILFKEFLMINEMASALALSDQSGDLLTGTITNPASLLGMRVPQHPLRREMFWSGIESTSMTRRFFLEEKRCCMVNLTNLKNDRPFAVDMKIFATFLGSKHV